MNELLKGIVIGIISCAAFAGIVWAIKALLFPLLQMIFYDVPRIAGIWQVYYSNDPEEKSVGNLTVKQFGKRIKGTARIWRNRSGEDVSRELTFFGSFRGSQMTIFYEDVKYRGHIVGVILLRLIGDQQNKEVYAGKAMYCHPTQESVEAYDLYLRR